MSSFDEMIDLPLDSSPLKPPTPTQSSTPPMPQSPGSPSPIAGALRRAQNKRPAEDMAQYAEEISRSHKFAKGEHDELVGFAGSGRSEQLIFIAGQLLSLAQHQRLLQPPDEIWALPKKLEDKIKSKGSILLTDSSIPAYRDDKIGPGKLLMDFVIANPSWGLGTELQQEQYAVSAVATKISKVLTTQRNTIKTAITKSLGSDPPAGTTLRLGALDVVKLTAIILSKLKVKAKVDLPMCGRVAILRKLISEKDDNKYWGQVDIKLASIRDKHTDPRKQSKFIKKYILDPDCAAYGQVDLKSLNSIAPAAPAVGVAGPGPSTSRRRSSPAAETNNEDDEE
ncbi:hypothetical protein DFH09DRAFT_1308896 [Mycena vulgaris]|nr:hypothetical protein DFH09DRAFT_1308896 [Mycena vulgaris]